MSKKLEITPEIAARLEKAYGGKVDTSKYSVFEAIAGNTMPLRRRTGLFNKAQLSSALLYEIASYLQSNSIPLQAMHDTGALPDGKVFWGEVRMNAMGLPELFVQFYVSNSEDKTIQKIEDATIDEVSMGLLSKSINCSACGFDYRGPEATWEHRWDLTCKNDHVIGKNGVHTILNGLEAIDELSLVNQGAVVGSKIVAKEQTKAKFRLAASSLDDNTEPFLLHLSCGCGDDHQQQQQENTGMSGTPTTPTPATGATVAEIIALSTEAATSKAALSVAEGKVADLTARLTAAETALTELRAKESDFQGHAALKASHDAMVEFLSANFKSVSAALGNLNPEVPADPMKLIAGLKDAAPNLATIYAPGGRSMNPGGGSTTAQLAVASAFRTPK